jgi:hypothetical protein
VSITLTELLISGIATVVLSAILGFFYHLSSKIEELQKQMERVTTQVSPLWARVQAKISEDLHHPDAKYHEMDALLEKLEALTITNGDRSRLKELLVERSKDMDGDITNDQRLKATLMITVMDMVLVENAVAQSKK